MSGPPRGWVEATVSDVLGPGKNSLADGPYGSKLKSSHYTDGGVRVVRLGNIGRGRYLSSSEAFISADYFRELQKHEVLEGDIVMAALGDPIGRCCAVPAHLLPAIVKADCFRIRLGSMIDPGYFLYWMNSDVAARLLSEEAHGVGRLRINLSDLRSMLVPLPPLAEQKRIVAKLDALNEKSTSARTELARIETLVSRYKLAVLSKAFSGELTQNWQVVALDLLSEAVFDGPFGSNLKSADYTPDGPRVVRLENIGTREFIEEKRTHISEDKFRSLARHTLQANDLLFSSFVSEEIRACLFPSNAGFRAINKADCFCIRLDKSKIDPKFALLQLTTEATYSYFVQQVHGATRPRINLSQLKQYPLVVPPLEEQHEIVRRIESAFTKIDRLAKEANRATELVGRLDEAILAKAFRGELVPQDPNDKPASALIERVGAWSTRVIKRGQGRPATSVERGVRGGGMTATASPLVEVANAMTAQQKDSSMTKTRQDPDVMGQPYLSKILRKQPGAGTVDALFKAADLPVADFYKQLAWEIENQLIRDKQDRLEAA